MDAYSPIDPLEWWEMQDGQFATIGKLAWKYLAIPASSAPSERVFSRAKLIQQAPAVEPSPSTFGGMCHA